MILAQYLTIFLTMATVLCCHFFIKKKYSNIDTNSILRVVSIVMAVVVFARYMWGDNVITDTYALVNNNFANSTEVLASLLLNWFLLAMSILVAMYPFYRNKTSLNIIRYIGSVVAVASTICLRVVTIGIVGSDAYTVFDVRTILIAIELGIILAYVVISFLPSNFTLPQGAEWCKLLYVVPMFVAMMPYSMMQSLFGEYGSAPSLIDFEMSHRVVLYILLGLFVVLYTVLRTKDMATIKLVLAYIALGQFVAYSAAYRLPYFFTHGIENWPLHLCNTGIYFTAYCSLVKSKRLFYFSLLINVFGAAVSLLVPNMSASTDIFSYGAYRYICSHIVVCIVPILMVLLNVYKRPNFKRFLYSCSIFTIYFVAMATINTIYDKDFFFINGTFITDKLGHWSEAVRNITITFTIFGQELTYRIVYQILFYLGYIACSVGMWFIYELFFQYTDRLSYMWDEEQKIKIDALAIQVSTGDKKMSKPILENKENIVTVSHFSKRYGKSDVYAVKDANLELHGGQIFGFLGPNGAGKSTIIKSLVGIQTITDGTINVCGFDMDKQSVMAKHNIGYVPDHYALYENLTGREFINYMADLYKVSASDRDLAIEKYVTLLNLQDAFDNAIKTYSHGMKQKITIISALVHNPKLWILDEPLTGLDPNSVYQVKECMKEHVSRGNIVFFSSHIIDVVEKICDKIAIIKKGNIIAYGDVKEIEKTTTIEQFYLSTIEQDVGAVHVEQEVLDRDRELSRKEEETKRQLTWENIKKIFTKKDKTNDQDNKTE